MSRQLSGTLFNLALDGWKTYRANVSSCFKSLIFNMHNGMSVAGYPVSLLTSVVRRTLISEQPESE